MSESCHRHEHHKWHRFWWRVAKYSSAALLVLLIIALVTGAIIRPRKPQFILQDTTLYASNISSNPSLLTSTLQVTLSSSNPNDRIEIYYDRLDVYATYGDQQITLRTQIPGSYEGQKDVDVWSPFIYGNSVP